MPQVPPALQGLVGAQILRCAQVEVQGCQLQQHDDWSATPLYYASLTGHQKLVKYLLKRGARCEQKVLQLSC